MKPRQFEPNYTPLGIWSDLEQMHEIAELDRDTTRDRVRDILTASVVGQLITPSTVKPAKNDRSRANQLTGEVSE